MFRKQYLTASSYKPKVKSQPIHFLNKFKSILAKGIKIHGGVPHVWPEIKNKRAHSMYGRARRSLVSFVVIEIAVIFSLYFVFHSRRAVHYRTQSVVGFLPSYLLARHGKRRFYTARWILHTLWLYVTVL